MKKLDSQLKVEIKLNVLIELLNESCDFCKAQHNLLEKILFGWLIIIIIKKRRRKKVKHKNNKQLHQLIRRQRQEEITFKKVLNIRLLYTKFDFKLISCLIRDAHTHKNKFIYIYFFVLNCYHC